MFSLIKKLFYCLLDNVCSAEAVTHSIDIDVNEEYLLENVDTTFFAQLRFFPQRAEQGVDVSQENLKQVTSYELFGFR